MLIPKRLTLSRRWLSLVKVSLVISIFCCSLLYFTPSLFVRRGRTIRVLEDESESKGFYEWQTKSKFDPVRQTDAGSKSLEDLCASFPTHLLEQIQPVLKTGHGTLEARVGLQLQSVSACLSNLLIVSDVDKFYHGRHVLDVIADIPERLTAKARQLRAWRDGKIEQITAIEEERGVKPYKRVGWQTDKYKFMAAVSRAWHMRRERKWYMFIEDDTYVVWDNVFRLLENFDPDLPYYFGSPTPGQIEGRAGWWFEETVRKQTWFANGGPGHILSREAVRRLVHEDRDREGEYLGSKLTERHWDELVEICCGDSILGWALWTQNVSLGGLWPLFNPHPPHGVPFSDAYWCQPLLTMHKPLEEDLIGLWRWESEQRDVERPLLNRDLAISYFDMGNRTIREDWNNGGWAGFSPPLDSQSYSHDPHESFDACGRACVAHEGCFQYNYHLRRCLFVRTIRSGKAEEPGLGKNYKSEASSFRKLSDWMFRVDEASKWNPEDLRYLAGWDTDKIRRWMAQRPCDVVQWVKPSTRRIF